MALNATRVAIDELWAFTQSIIVEASSEDLWVADFASKRCRQVGEALNVALDSIAALLSDVGDLSILQIGRGIDSLTEGVHEALEGQGRVGARVEVVASSQNDLAAKLAKLDAFLQEFERQTGDAVCKVTKIQMEHLQPIWDRLRRLEGPAAASSP